MTAFRSELAKVTTARGLVVGALVATSALPVVTLLVVVTGGIGADDTLTSAAATGTVAGLLGFGAWGAFVGSGEYALHTLPLSLTLVPRRRTLYAAKAGAVAGIVAGTAAVAVLTSFLLVLAVKPPGQHELGHPLALLAYVLAAVAVAVSGVAVGVLTRSPTAAVTAVAAAVLLPKAAAGLLGELQPWVVGASPGTVVTQAVGGAQLAAVQVFPLGTGLAILAMLLVAVGVTTAAAGAFARRDG